MKEREERSGIPDDRRGTAQQIKTLLVEDDVDFRQLLKEILINHFPFLNIKEAASSEQALQKIAQCTPQLIFMNTTMFEGSSIPSITKIKKAHPEIVVIALALYAIKEYEEAALQSGADYFLAKSSLTGETLITLVATIVSARS
jgi:DNA-binding NarL/FixJ family response regulator